MYVVVCSRLIKKKIKNDFFFFMSFFSFKEPQFDPHHLRPMFSILTNLPVCFSENLLTRILSFALFLPVFRQYTFFFRNMFFKRCSQPQADLPMRLNDYLIWSCQGCVEASQAIRSTFFFFFWNSFFFGNFFLLRHYGELSFPHTKISSRTLSFTRNF